MAKRDSNLHRPTRLLERGRDEGGNKPHGKVNRDRNGDILKSPAMLSGFAGGECYPGNNDSYSLGLRNKSPKVSGNIKLSKAFAERKADDGRYYGPFGSVISRPDYFNKEGAARKERDSHMMKYSSADHRGFEQE